MRMRTSAYIVTTNTNIEFFLDVHQKLGAKTDILSHDFTNQDFIDFLILSATQLGIVAVARSLGSNLCMASSTPVARVLYLQSFV